MVSTVDWVVKGHHFSAGVYAKECHIPAGTALLSHKHNYDHMSILASGQVLVIVDGKPEQFNAPAALDIKAHTHHTVYAITDAVWFCIHPTSETDPAMIDEQLVEG